MIQCQISTIKPENMKVSVTSDLRWMVIKGDIRTFHRWMICLLSRISTQKDSPLQNDLFTPVFHLAAGGSR